MDTQPIKLTSLSHGGGCGCKIAPSVLAEMLSELPSQFSYPALMIGLESNDDAAVYKINDHQAVIATTDFFMPIVDDPFDFGRIAAANALSDVYAVGGTPILALALVGMPVGKLPVKVMQAVLAGGAAVCKEAGIPVAGGHSIDSQEPIYGLAAVGLINPGAVKHNDRAEAGDVLILGKPLGIGILSAALKNGELDDRGYQEMLSVTTQLNTVGSLLGEHLCVHAMTDVTGFGLLGHLLEMCRGSHLAATVEAAQLPVLPTALEHARRGTNTGAAGRNWNSYSHWVGLPADVADWQRHILCDPQTSGGLLVACDPPHADEILQLFQDNGFGDAAVIGAMADGEPGVTVV